jgi:signal transduction histidine kinase/DNA-binding response OmpR family regulator
MTAIEYELDPNLEELRGHLVVRVALLTMEVSGLLAWLALPRQPFPIIAFGLLAALLGLGIGARMLINIYPTLARHLLVWGLTAGLLTAMWQFPDPWLPFLGLPLTFIGAVLVPGGEFATASAIAALAAWLARSGARTYPLPELLFVLALDVALAWQIVRTLYTALEWAWTMQQRADHLLELARDRQGELSRTLKSLDSSNTLLQRTQRELIAAHRQTEQALLMKEQFAANVSHELRTPLNLILGFSEMMYLSPEVYGDLYWPPRLRQAIYQIYHSSRHLLEMINDILDLSRFEIAGFTLAKEPTPLESLLRDTLDIAGDLFQGQPVCLEVELASDLPTLEIDRTRIRQVLLNLLNNAARFTEEGTVRLEAKQAGGEVVISISDTGPGIPADRLPYIFDEFYQVGRSRREHEGAGLGLAISRRFVEAHDARLWVESQEGAGSTFFFTLPIPAQHVPLSRLQVTPLSTPSLPRISAPILVVDPDPAIAALIRRHVGEYEVVQIEDADRLAEAVQQHHPQAVVCNVQPGKRGLYDSIISTPVPFIECSLPSQTWVADNLAVAACLTKPVLAQQLLREIERLGTIHNVLIIDDERGFCQLVEQILSATGRDFDVRHAYDGEEGMLALYARRPDLVLLDLIMPRVDGLQVLKEMRQDPELVDVPVILLTATSYVEDALTQLGGQMIIHRSSGLHSAEVLRCLRAVIGVLEPHYNKQSAPEEALVMHET